VRSRKAIESGRCSSARCDALGLLTCGGIAAEYQEKELACTFAVFHEHPLKFDGEGNYHVPHGDGAMPTKLPRGTVYLLVSRSLAYSASLASFVGVAYT
jgi:hypothetical protein